MKSTKNKKTKNYIIVGVVILIIGLTIAIGSVLYNSQIISPDYFYANSKINGIDVSGLNKYEATNVVSTEILKDLKDIEINLKKDEKNWTLKGSDFEVNNNIFGIIEQSLKHGRHGTISNRISIARQAKNRGFNVDISYRYILGNFDEKLDSIISEINKEKIEPEVIFTPNENKIFTIKNGENGIQVDKEKLYDLIDEKLLDNNKIEIDIPTQIIPYETQKEDLEKNIQLRSAFKTTLVGSASGRRHNVNLALSCFNGMIINPDTEISFNRTTGEKSDSKGYKKANIILNGMFVEGIGGGVCQASTTLYNALLLADIPVLEVHPHTLPVSYVPLGFDAMVYEGSSDLRFKNNLDSPLYIRTYTTKENAVVEIYSQKLPAGTEIKLKSEFVESIPHNGDRIVKDTEGKYQNKVMFKGEYMRLKYPQQGYHSKGIIEYYKDGELVDKKVVRDEKYSPQQGIIIEGVEELGEGMTLPENTVKIISPQIKKVESEENAINKIKNNNPSNLNP